MLAVVQQRNVPEAIRSLSTMEKSAFVWPAVSIVHRRAVPGLLRAGVKRLSR